MEWMKAGRKSKLNAVSGDIETVDEAWTVNELRILAAKPIDAWKMLAVAVIKQWQYDGSKESEYCNISPWIDVIKHLSCDNSNVYTQGDINENLF